VEAATPTDPLPWLVSANGVEHACVPLVAGGDTVGLLLAGSLDHGPHATARLGDLTEVAAIASALLGPAILERVEERRLHAEVSRVIADRCFRPIFQPIVDLTTGDVIGYEALTRFADDRRPDRVFADARRVGLGVELEAATFEAAVQAARALPGNQTLHLNVSPDFVLSGPRFRALVSSAGRVVLEITEHTEVQDYETLRAAIAELGDCVRLAVDDAGAGYASLRHILELRPSVVKVDRGIVAGVDRDPARQAVLAGIVHFARQAKCSLVAEGVETEAERDALLGVGISRGQGWLFGGVVQADNPTGPAGP
jgi:EAL domain-containing protein (putative c-di-GMP-specific phosphodiesterase class I)